MVGTRNSLSRERLDEIYEEWNRPEFISPDPLETLADYPRTEDREIVALLAGAMAYGRVKALLVPLKKVLIVMGSSPRDYVLQRRKAEIATDLEGIVHRFAKPPHLAALLAGMGGAVGRLGSLEAAFLAGYQPGAGATADFESEPPVPALPGGNSRGDVMAGLKSLESAIRSSASGEPGHLLIDPAKGSACKRLFLFLRWMVRQDAVDPGGWDTVNPADLMLPLDTWTYRISLSAGWTTRKSADLRTVREVSTALSNLNPEDPVKYDFALSRFGIRSGLQIDQLFT